MTSTTPQINHGNKSTPRIQVMSMNPAVERRPRRKSRDTGFPEPFNDDRNTTLPHPDADLSPNACLCEEDINPDRCLTRTHRSFLRKHSHRHVLQHGKITPQAEALYSVVSLVNNTTDADTQKPPSPSIVSSRLSKDGTDSIASRREEETPPTSPDVPSHHSKKHLLRKWRSKE
ncbi:hypothetical protein G7046_g1081 [Stylonectria norvegica]|nr:hypothetical protein G7046_g1081 [Stylonectria norvegica]